MGRGVTYTQIFTELSKILCNGYLGLHQDKISLLAFKWHLLRIYTSNSLMNVIFHYSWYPKFWKFVRQESSDLPVPFLFYEGPNVISLVNPA